MNMFAHANSKCDYFCTKKIVKNCFATEKLT